MFSFLIVIQSGCSSKKELNIKPLLNNFDCEFEILNTNISGTMKVDSEYNITFEILHPNNIHGTKLEVFQDYFTVFVGDISKKYRKQEQDKQTTPYYIYSALKCSESKMFSTNNDELFIEDNCDGGKYKININNLGFVEKIELKNNNQIFILHNQNKTAT